MLDENKIPEIINIILKIQESEMPINIYFNQNLVPFSRAQYYRYCKILEKYGENGLKDKRQYGNHTKLTQQIKDYILLLVNEDRSISIEELKNKILNQFIINISESSLKRFLISEKIILSPVLQNLTRIIIKNLVEVKFLLVGVLHGDQKIISC